MGNPDREETDGELFEAIAEDPTTFASVTGHLYRAEVDRMTAWRTRLDQTTNWAVILMAAILTFTFASPDNPHYVVLVGVLGVAAFLVIEAQRYQEYDVWRSRVRLLQRGLLVGALAPDEKRTDDWRAQLAADLRTPELTIGLWRSMGHRLLRVYFLLLSVLLAAWALRISVFAPDEFWTDTAAIGSLPGELVVAIVVGVYGFAGAVVLWSFRQSRAREFGSDGSGDDPPA